MPVSYRKNLTSVAGVCALELVVDEPFLMHDEGRTYPPPDRR